jgi:shikimate dehydrogenase
VTAAGVLGEGVARFRAAVIGSPVRHSLSPRIHDAAYAALGLDWRYGAFEVEGADTAAAIREAGRADYVGLSVTTPLKFAAAAACPGSDAVEAIGAANTVVFGGAGPWAHNTDGEGLLDDLHEAFGFDARGRRCGVIGAGATARAIVRALDVAGAREIVVVNRSRERARAAAILGPKTARVGRGSDLGGLDLVVYAAKPIPFRRGGEPAAFVSVVASAIESQQLVVDVNYHPVRSSFLDICTARGAVIRNGLGMLVHQAARQVELFTGEPAPLEAMWDAVRTVENGQEAAF